MVKCVFCGREEPAFIGMHYINNDGNVSYFCSSKCRKNALKLKRERRKIKWTQAFREVRAEALVKSNKIKHAQAAKKAEEHSKEHEHAHDEHSHTHPHEPSEVKIEHKDVKHEYKEDKKEVKAKKTTKKE
jgi:large subunit ribosomal protein L24e